MVLKAQVAEADRLLADLIKSSALTMAGHCRQMPTARTIACAQVALIRGVSTTLPLQMVRIFQNRALTCQSMSAKHCCLSTTALLTKNSSADVKEAKPIM